MAETREFNLQVNLAGVSLADVMNEDPSPGPHMMEILDVREVTSEKEGGKTSLRFMCMDVEEGSISRGISTQMVIGTDWEKGEKFNARHLKNLLCGMGVKAERLTGVIRINAATFIGKRCPVYVKAPPSEVDELGRKQFANKNFITLEMYEAAKRSASAMRAIPAANQRMVTTPQPSFGPSTTMTPPPIQAANGPIVPPAANQPGVGLEDLFA